MLKALLDKIHKLDLTEGDIVKNICVLAFPMIAGNVLQTVFNVVDMIWVGRIGPEAIASVAMSGVILMVVMTLIIGVSTGTQAMVSRFIGARDRVSAENVAMQSLIIGAVLSVIIAGLGLMFSRHILQLLGASSGVLEMGTEYLKIMLSGSLVMVYLFLINAVLYAAGDSVRPTLIMAGAVLLNVILDPLMIFGIGFPAMGVKGAALATVVSRGLASLAGMYILFQGSSLLHVKMEKFFVDIRTIVRILKVGFPNSIQMALRSVVGLGLMAIVAHYGNYAICAYGIGIRVFSVVLMPAFALAGSAATLVGQNLGAGKFARAKQSAWSCAAFNTLLMGVAGIVFFIFADQMISIFNTNPSIVKLGSEYLKITSFSYIFVAQGVVLGRSLMGAGDTVSPLLISVVALVGIQIPLAIILPAYFHTGITGIWWAIVISAVLQGGFTSFWFNLGRWRLKEV